MIDQKYEVLLDLVKGNEKALSMSSSTFVEKLRVLCSLLNNKGDIEEIRYLCNALGLKRKAEKSISIFANKEDVTAIIKHLFD